ncbi:hypothetical protein [Saccharibacillus sacchari]|uniref:Uncharacterized protein n=1 Tax=Saccharibacillus sacchari TaxID=456493 RepID=A0ACC6PAW5_9BACL
MISKLWDEYHSGINKFDKPGECLYIATAEENVVAVCGLNIDPYLGQTDIGRVRHSTVQQNRIREFERTVQSKSYHELEK